MEHFEKPFTFWPFLKSLLKFDSTFCLDAKSSKKMESVEALVKIGAEKLQRKKSKASTVEYL